LIGNFSHGQRSTPHFVTQPISNIESMRKCKQMQINIRQWGNITSFLSKLFYHLYWFLLWLLLMNSKWELINHMTSFRIPQLFHNLWCCN
jgi:hypothetical protein